MLFYAQKPPPRAETQAYLATARFPPPDEPPAATFADVSQPEPAAARACAAAYLARATFVSEDEPATAAFAHGIELPARAPAAPRAAGVAYQAQTRLVDPDLLSFASILVADFARPVRLAPREAYAIPTRASVLIDSGVPMARGYIDEVPRLSPRGGQRAEQLQQRAQDLPEEPGTWGMIDDKPRLPARAAREAYSTPLLRPWDEEPCDWGFVTQRAPPSPRPALVAYWVEHVAQIEGPDAPAFGSSWLAEPLFVPRLADYSQFAPMVRDEPEIGRIFYEASGVRRQASVPSAYWVDQRASISDPDAPPGGLSVVRGPWSVALPRTTHYGPLTTFPPPDPPAPGALVLSVQPRPTPAAAEAYWPPPRDLTLLELGLPAQYGQIAVPLPIATRRTTDYGQLTTFILADPPTDGVPQLAEPLPVYRLPSTVYQVAVSFVLADPPTSGVPQIGEPLPVYRLPSAVYQVAASFPPTEEILIHGYQADLARRPQRAPPSAYHVEGVTTTIGGDEPAPGTYWQIVSQPTPPARLRTTDYGQLTPIQIDELPPAGQGDVAQPLPVYRLPSAVYVVLPAARSAEPDEPFCRGYVEALGDRRWASASQATAVTPAIAIDAPPLPYGRVTQPLPVYRLPSTVYAVLPGAMAAEPDPPAAAGTIAAPQRLPICNLQFALCNPPADEPPLPFGQVTQPLPAYRLPSTVYQVLPGAMSAEVDDPSALGHIEPRGRLSPRAAAAAYAVPQRADSAGASEPAAWGFVERFPRRAVRAGWSAYLAIAGFGLSPPVRLGTTVAVFGAWGETHNVLGGDSSQVQVFGEDSGEETID